jgi:hypothetical protein
MPRPAQTTYELRQWWVDEFGNYHGIVFNDIHHNEGLRPMPDGTYTIVQHWWLRNKPCEYRDHFLLPTWGFTDNRSENVKLMKSEKKP